MAGGAEVAALAAEGEHVLGAAIVAAHAGEAGLEDAALEEPRDDLVDDIAPSAVLALEAVFVAAAEGIEVFDQQPVERRGHRPSGAVDAGRGSCASQGLPPTSRRVARITLLAHHRRGQGGPRHDRAAEEALTRVRWRTGTNTVARVAGAAAMSRRRVAAACPAPLPAWRVDHFSVIANACRRCVPGRHVLRRYMLRRYCPPTS